MDQSLLYSNILVTLVAHLSYVLHSPYHISHKLIIIVKYRKINIKCHKYVDANSY
ncbi:hypothetical protein Lalb_Chr05g0222941 [Lupinus albus]|uniref:Uncharacterized protein n=1 Tax=Lupinus albus TaxID=3870 RepID=A0A6A4QJ35_LUPAL|nr:hypothetical protein Lalb_Chr05g0222941 [Lupinus albus]